MGFGLGAIISLIKEKKEDIIYDSGSIYDKFGFQKIVDIPIKNKKNILESIKLINSAILSKVDKEIAIIPAGEINDNAINKIYNSFEESANNKIP